MAIAVDQCPVALEKEGRSPFGTLVLKTVLPVREGQLKATNYLLLVGTSHRPTAYRGGVKKTGGQDFGVDAKEAPSRFPGC